MKFRVFLVTILGLLMAMATGAAQADGWEDKLKKIYPAAKKEGELVFNSRRITEVGGKKGVAQFKKRFPGIKITFTGISGSKLPSRIIAEAKSGRVRVDAFRSDPNRAEPLAKRGLLLKVNMAELTDQPVKSFFDGQFFKLSDHITNFAYNTELVKSSDRPKTYEDLLDPKWQRKLILDARGGQIAHLLSNKLWDEGRFWKLVKGLEAQKPIWTARNSEAMAKLTSGEGSIGTGSYAAIEALKKKGAPVEFLFLSPSLSQVRGVGITKDGAHPNAAKLFVGWLLSPEGLKARDENAVSTFEPGTTLYKKVKAAGAEILAEDDLGQILARDDVSKRITNEWGVLKMLKKKRKKKKKKKKQS